jgi:hypothetical protein
MWLDTFRSLGENEQSLACVLLKDRIPLALNGSRLASSLLERASGLLAARLPVRLAEHEKRRLVFLLPNATQSLGRFLAVSLLLADFVHRQGIGVAHQEQGELIRGDLLLVTQHIGDCVKLLRSVAIKYGSQELPLTKFWPIEVISQYTPPANGIPRVFIANPGWSSAIGERRAFGSVVLDVSHPRTADHLDKLLMQPSIAAAPVQIIIIPPCEKSRLDAFQDPSRHSCLAWAWDPAALDALQEVVGRGASVQKPPPSQRHLWVCEDDEVDELLAELHDLLVGAMRAGGGRVPAPVLEVWAVYHRLRQLAVPLVQLEEERRKTYQTVTLKERLESIEESQPTCSAGLGSYLESRWPKIVHTLKTAYELFLKRKEPSKFYTLASAVEEHLKAGDSTTRPLRIVASSTHEASMLAALLGEIVTGWGEALQSGAITVSTAREEPRLVAEGLSQETALLGFRTSETRYLDVYPAVPVHVVCYPYEVQIDESIQHRVHSSIEEMQEDTSRATVLRSLHLPEPRRLVGANGANRPFAPAPRTMRPDVNCRGVTSPQKSATRQFHGAESVEPLDIEKLAGLTWWDDIVAAGSSSDSSGAGGSGTGSKLELVEVVTTVGERLRYPATQLIDVFYPATEIKERVPAGELRSGMLMVMLVDDPYEDLFHRLLEAIREQRDVRASMALDLWQQAKQAALTRHGGIRRRLHEALSANGLGVEYEATVAWFCGGEDEIIAPQSREDFAILCRATGIYTDESLINATYACITTERNMRRRCGRILSRLLAQIAAGQNFDAALESAKVLGSPVEHVAAAVALREIEAVRKLGGLPSVGA